MERIGNLIRQPSSEPSAARSEEPPHRPRLSQRAVDGIFTYLEGAYGRLFTAQFTDLTQVKTYKATWCDMLAGLTPDHIEHGLNRIRDETPRLPPNAVEFRRLCLGLPDRDSTIRRVRELRPGADPVAREIITRLPSWTVRHATYQELERAAHEHYTDAVAAIEHEQLVALPAGEDG